MTHLPAMMFQVNSPGIIEKHALRMQQAFLFEVTLAMFSRTDSALCIDDPMPGEIEVVGDRSHCITDMPRGTSSHTCYVSITRNFAIRNLLNDTVDFSV